MKEYIQKLESAFRRRQLCKSVERHNVACEACGTNIPRYIGPEYGILCRACLEVNWDACFCGNVRPNTWYTTDGSRDYELEE